MQCLEELTSKHEYAERSSTRIDKYRDSDRHKRRHYDEDDEFVRYY